MFYRTSTASSQFSHEPTPSVEGLVDPHQTPGCLPGNPPWLGHALASGASVGPSNMGHHMGSTGSCSSAPSQFPYQNSPFTAVSALPLRSSGELANVLGNSTRHHQTNQHHSAMAQPQQQQQLPAPRAQPQQLPAPPAQQQRPRQQLTLPGLPTFVGTPQQLSLTATPPLFSTPDELHLLEPHASDALEQILGSLESVGQAYPELGSGVEAYRRAISSPANWDVPLFGSGQHMLPASAGTILEPQSGMGSRSEVGLPLSSGAVSLAHTSSQKRPSTSGKRFSPPTSATYTASSAGLTEDTGIDRSLHAAAATACQAMAGASASTIERMVAELPPELQPIVMAKLSVRGRGGRHPAADPRSVDPNMDPRKVRRILANRQSAARSKLKSRVLLETLRVGKDMMAERQETVQEELTRLTNLVKELEIRNKQLEERLTLSEQIRLHELQQHQHQLHQLHSQPGPQPLMQPQHQHHQHHHQHQQEQCHAYNRGPAPAIAIEDELEKEIQCCWSDAEM